MCDREEYAGGITRDKKKEAYYIGKKQWSKI